MDPEVQELTERIEAARAAIERRQAPAEEGEGRAALRDQVTAARAGLAELQGAAPSTPRPGRSGRLALDALRSAHG